MHIIIVGGGTAGWLTAGILASRYATEKVTADSPAITISLIESPDVATIGVGEGTWPSMRTTLQTMGVSETQFINECDVSLKQGTRFENWTINQNEVYHHPFSLPESFHDINLAEWRHEFPEGLSFEKAVCAQASICEAGLAAKSITTPEYAFNLNYGYHVDAGKFAKFLQKHCIENLGVNYVQDHIFDVLSDTEGNIISLIGKNNGYVSGDVFIDCTGFSALLSKGHFNLPYKQLKDQLFNDKAVAVQVPYAGDQLMLDKQLLRKVWVE